MEQAVAKQLAESQSSLVSAEGALSDQTKQMELNKIATETKQATMAAGNETSASELAKCQTVLATAEKDIADKSNAIKALKNQVSAVELTLSAKSKLLEAKTAALGVMACELNVVKSKCKGLELLKSGEEAR